MNYKKISSDLIDRIKKNYLFVLFSIGFIIFILIIFGTVKVNISANKSSKKIKQLNQELNTYFGNVQGLRQNADYIQALIDYSDPDNTVSKSTSGYCLRDFYIASSSNSIVCNKLYNGFINVDMIGAVLDNGARLLTLDIFSDSYCDTGRPVVSHHNPTKDYLYNQIGTYNYIDLNACCQKINEHAFSKNDDPLILVLQLHLNKLPAKNNENVIEQISSILVKKFKGRLLGPDYSYQRTIIGNAPIEDLFGKIVIICDQGFSGTSLDEIVNYSWSEKSAIAKDSKSPCFMLHYTSTQLNEVSSDGFSLLQTQNKKGITIVNADSRTSSKSVNYNIEFAWEAGCQCVGIDYFNNESVQIYENKFSESSFVLKPEKLRYIQEYISYNNYQDPKYSMEGRTIKSDSGFADGLVI